MRDSAIQGVMHALGPAALLLWPCAGTALAGSGEAVPGGNFESGLGAWTTVVGTPSGAFSAPLGPGGGPGGLVAACTLLAGQQGRLERRVPVTPGEFIEAAPEPGRPGARAQLGAWVWLDPASTGAGEAWLELLAHDGSSEQLLARSPGIGPLAGSAGSWVFLATAPVAGSDGRVPTGTSELRYRLVSTVAGEVAFDGVRVRLAEREELELVDGGFEGWTPGSPGWQIAGAVSSEPGEVHRGVGGARLGPGASLEQTLDLGPAALVSYPAVSAGEFVELGAWLRFPSGVGLPGTAQPSLFVELSVLARSPAVPGSERVVARARWSPRASEAGEWRYLETEPTGGALQAGEELLRVRLVHNLGAELTVDEVQVGEQHGVDGHPRRRVGASYVGRYRSPLYAGTRTQPNTAAERWRNWHWQEPTACDPTYAGFFHSPDCSTSSTCLRADGRRDVAVSIEGSAPTPLAGAYDSRDPEILRYHLGLARSVGIDHFIYDWLGERLGAQDVAYGREPINHETLEALLVEAERPGQDLKVAVMYEPKGHLLGWVAGQPTLGEKIAGITADLTWLANRARGSRAVLRSDGRLVVFVFRVFGCDPSGTQCLDEAAWSQIHATVLAATGEDLLLVADSAPAAGSVLDGFTRWRLIALELLRYRTFAEAVARIPSAPAPTLAALEAHVEGLARQVHDWGAEDEDGRTPVMTVWPHFDDSGVGGWRSGNLVGADGTPLCVRVMDPQQGQIYAKTVEAAFRHDIDWVQIATWNDWNEETRLEPAWHPDLVAPVPVGSPPLAGPNEHAFGRLLETRQWIASFKGVEPTGPGPRAVALRYLSRARRLPWVVLYD